METDKKLLAFLSGFFASIAFSSVSPLPLSAGVFIFIIALGFFAAVRCGLRFALAPLFLLGASLGLIRFAFAENARFPAQPIVLAEDGKAHVAGVISEEPKEEEEGTKLVVKLDGERGKVYLTVPAYPRYEYGDRLELAGKIDLATDRETGEISPIRHDIFYLMFRPEITVVSQGNGSQVISALLFMKRRFLESIARSIPEPYAAFGGGITVGARSGLPKELSESFNRTSTTHLIAVSGFNLSLIANLLFDGVAYFSVVLAPYASVLAVVLFTLLTGASGATIRAAAMSLLLVYAKRRGRLYDASRAILAAAFFLALWRPHILFFDLSFQLSLLATVGIVYVSPLLERRLARLSLPPFLSEILSGTLAAELLVLPLIVYEIGDLSLVGLPTNVFVLPFVWPAMVAVFWTGFFGIFSKILAAPFALISYGILGYQISVIRFFASLPFASVHFESVSLSSVVFVYALIAYFTRREYLWQAHLAKLAQSGVTEEALLYEIVEDEVPR